MPVDQYLLSFNFSEIANQVATIQGSYTDFGKAIKASTDDLIINFSSLTDQVETFRESFSQVSAITDQQYAKFLQNANETAKVFSVLAKNSKSIVKSFDQIKGFDFRNLGKESPADRVNAVIPGAAPGGAQLDLAKDAKKDAAEALKIVKRARKDLEKLRAEAQGEVKGLRAYIEKEMTEAKRSIKGIATRSMPGGVLGGGIVSGMIAAMVLGVAEQQRKEKEKGEMLNVFEALGSAFTKQGDKAVSWFSDFQEKAQRYYGIAKEQTQAVVKAMVDAGYDVNEILGDAKDKVFEVSSNVATLSMGLDAYFGLASGQSMAGMNELVTQYGDSLEVASEKYKDLMFTAQRSGMGVNKFVDAVRSGSQALTQYGIDVKDVAESLLAVKKHYEDLGMTSQAAGMWAGKGAQAAAQGLAQSSKFNIMVMQNLNPEMDYYHAKQALEEGWLQEDKAKRYGQFIRAVVNLAQEKVGPDEAKQKAYLEQEGGYSYLAATHLLNAYKENIDSQGNLVNATKDQLEAFEKAFETEGKTLTELQKTQHQLIDSIAKIGQGLLQVVTGLFGTIVTGFASIPMLIKALTMEGKERETALNRIVNINNAQLGNLVAGFDKTTEGGKQLASVLGEGFEKIFPNFEELKSLQESIDKNTGGKSVSQAVGERGVEAVAGWAGVEKPRAFAEEFEKSAQNFMRPITDRIDYLLDDERKNEYDQLRKNLEEAKEFRIQDYIKYKEVEEKRPKKRFIEGKPISVSEGVARLPEAPKLKPLSFGRDLRPPQPKPISIKEPFEVKGSAPAPESKGAQNTVLPVYKGPSSVPAPKTTLSASALHNSATSLQSTLASEMSR